MEGREVGSRAIAGRVNRLLDAIEPGPSTSRASYLYSRCSRKNVLVQDRVSATANRTDFKGKFHFNFVLSAYSYSLLSRKSCMDSAAQQSKFLWTHGVKQQQWYTIASRLSSERLNSSPTSQWFPFIYFWSPDNRDDILFPFNTTKRETFETREKPFT